MGFSRLRANDARIEEQFDQHLRLQILHPEHHLNTRMGKRKRKEEGEEEGEGGEEEEEKKRMRKGKGKRKGNRKRE